MKELCKCKIILRCIFPLIFSYMIAISSHADVPSNGDWIVTGLETVENQIITLNGNLIIENGGNLTLSGITLTMDNDYDGEYGIRVKSGSTITIEKGTVITAASGSAHFSFAVESGSQFFMKDSELHECGWGPDSEDLWDKEPILSGMRGLVIDTTNAVIENNSLSSNHIGIILTGSGISLDNNHIHSNKVHGVYIRGGLTCQITNNSIQHASISSPFRIVEGEDNTIKSNTITLSLIHRGVIETMLSHGNVIEENDILGLGVGVSLMFVSNNNIVRGNTIATDETGIMVWGWNNKIEGNIISDPSGRPANGIYMVYAYNCMVTDNTISNITTEGIWVRHSSNNTFMNNKISASSSPETDWSSAFLIMSSSRDNVIYGNTTSGFLRGISLLFSCDGNMIAANEITSNNYQGVVIDDCTNNVIYGNNFVNYGRSPYDNSENQWEHDGMGNYWSEYVGIDTNGDGVGDAPYMIGPDGADNFPLMDLVTVGSLPVPEVTLATPPEYDLLLGKTVTGEEVIENQTIVLNNINVEAGGSLTLRNVELVTGASQLCSDLNVASGGSLSIYNCKIIHLDNGYGFQIQPIKGSTFIMKDSEIVGSGHEMWYGGIQIHTDNAILENNIITDSMISFFNTNGGQVVGNTISGSYWAVNIEGSSNITVSNNTIYNCIERAIGAFDSSNITLSNNTVSDSWGNGVGTWLSSNSQIRGNSISDMHETCLEAISAGGTSGEANENNVSDCFFGLRLGQGNIAKNNRISNCSTGIKLDWGSYVEGNVILSCDAGIDLNGETHQLIGNTLSWCNTGIQSGFSKNNFIYHNNFIENVIQAFAENCDNQWDDESEGNYWSDYSGVDANNDGIGDIPYYIGSSGVDSYPLVLPWGFAISSVHPQSNAFDVPIDTTISINFSEPINATTITESTFFASDSTQNVFCTLNCSDMTATLTPSQHLQYDTHYCVTVTRDVETMSGRTFPDEYTWSFTTCAAQTFYRDADIDGCGDPLDTTQGCIAPLGYVSDNSDNCPTDPHKNEPETCGCGVSETDTDSDGTPDCIDNCPQDENKTNPGDCGCGNPETDTDSDGTPDCIDNCPEDINKINPGDCGCGVSDVDTDSDGTLDCNDNCPQDENKTEPGDCGCGNPETDTDSDGTPDCIDNCPEDINKINPGDCGCGNPETDTDSDGTPDCNDGCPNDPNKIVPGNNGCGSPEDEDGSGDDGGSSGFCFISTLRY
jgi:parallel beta-helix repeat protein